jgi:hypothetical protein
METQEEIKKELNSLLEEVNSLVELARKIDQIWAFGNRYQNWYSRALKIVSLLGVDRLEEFRSYYLIDPKRKSIAFSNYVIQDYLKAVGAKLDFRQQPLWNIHDAVAVRVITQAQILQSLASRIDSILADVEGSLFAELQDEELKAATKLVAVSPRAAGALAGVVLERHLQRVVNNHQLKIKKSNPTISDLNDPLKQADVYDTVVWRKIQLLADLRNLCSHNKNREPAREEVEELIAGVDSIIRSVF